MSERASESSKAEDLFVEIRSRLDCGIVLEGKVLDFVHSTFGIASVKELGTAMSEPCELDSEVLLDYLFFPDSSLRLLLEPLLAGRAWTAEDEEYLCRLLCDPTPSLVVRSPDGKDSVSLTLPSDLIPDFIRRLYLTRTPCGGKAGLAMESFLPERKRLELRVRLRCLPAPVPAGADHLLARFIRKSAGRETFDRLLDTLLAILEELPAGMELEAYLLVKRQTWRTLFDRIVSLETRTATHGMEYLLMTRNPPPPQSKEVVAESLSALDELIHILGLPLPGSAPLVREPAVFDISRDPDR